MGLRWQRGLTGVSSAPSWLGSFRPEPFATFRWFDLRTSFEASGIMECQMRGRRDTLRRREARARPSIVVSLEQARRPSYQRILERRERGEEDFRQTVRTDASTPNKPSLRKPPSKEQKKGSL